MNKNTTWKNTEQIKFVETKILAEDKRQEENDERNTTEIQMVKNEKHAT